MSTEGPNGFDLKRAMELFEETTAGLKNSYSRLQEELKDLNDKLDKKDRELGASLAERDRLASYLEHLLESVPSGVIAVDPDGRISKMNRAAVLLAGLGGDALGRHFWDVFPAAKKPSGKDLDLRTLSVKPHKIVEIKRKDGERLLLDVSVSPFIDGDRGVAGRVVVFDDVTRLKRLEEQEQRNLRLVSMGEMAAGIAHEIRNPLGSLELFASHLADELRGGSYEDLAGHILKGIQNLSRITGNLLLYARKIETQKKRMDVSAVVADSLLYARSAVNAKKVLLEEALGPAVAEIDPDLLGQAVLNVILNSVQAVNEGGRIKVECGLDKSEDPPMVVVRVSDDGPGVPAEARERIFDPFFTTRATGVGLGLAIVQRIVSAHRGYVALYEPELGGAGFEIGLPADNGGGE